MYKFAINKINCFLVKIKFVIFKFFGVIILFSIITSCVREDSFPVGKIIMSDAEMLTKNKKQFIASNDSTFYFDGGKKRTSNESHSGNYSVFTYPGSKAFAFGFKLRNLKADSYFKFSVWRKSKDGKGALVVAAKNPKNYYTATINVVERGNDGWEKLSMEVFIPPLDYGGNTFSFYAWNNSSDTVYYDDISIERFASKTYPEYDNLPLRISLDTSQYIKLYNKRKIALTNGILQTGDNDWVKGFVFGDGKMMKAKMRLKGDWLDHLKGDKWSFRIKMRKDNAWKRMRTFSVQTPLARNFLLEWSSHKFYEAKDILTTSYGFVPLYINNSNKGLYAWEEHFVKQLLESRNRREGPIVKFSEDPFWQLQKMSIFTGKWYSFPFYETSVIKPFSASKTVENPVLFNQFLNAQKLMHQYKNQLMPVDEIFDIDKLAAYYAMLDLTHARHGMVWHNQRFYYNPFIGKLEPIAFDGYTDHSKPDLSINDNLAHMVINQKILDPEQLLFYDFFRQKNFLDKYVAYLYEFSDSDFVNLINNKINKEEIYYDSLLKMEFYNYSYDFDFYTNSAKSIRNYLPKLENEIDDFLESGREFKVKERKYNDSTVFENTPEFFVNAYLETTTDDSVVLKVFNYFPHNIIILGTGRKNKNVHSYQLPEPKLMAYRGNSIQSIDIATDTGSNYLFFMLEGRFETYKTEINPWPYPQGKTIQQELNDSSDLATYDFIEMINDNKIYIKQGISEINYNVVIPKSYEVFFKPGTQLNFIDSAMFLSYSPVIMQGTSDNPIIIKSSDFSANGFTILQAEKKSFVNNVKFENLNTLDYKGWTLTGAVTFYESDVDIKNTKFYRNQCEDALNIIRSGFTLQNSSFDYIFADAFDSDFSVGEVLNTIFTNIGNDAIDFSGSDILIADTKMYDVSDKGISGGEDSRLIVRNCVVERANIGIASKDLSTVIVESTKLEDCNYGIVLLKKKPEYGPAIMILKDVEFINAKTEKLIEEGSVVTENGKRIEGKIKNVADMFY